MEDRCVCCGEIIPEGRGFVCKKCEENIFPEGVTPKSKKKQNNQGKMVFPLRRYKGGVFKKMKYHFSK